MGSYSFGLALRGANAGLQAAKQQGRADEDYNYTRLQREQGQEDRTHRLQRQDITEGRDDEDYNRRKEAADRYREGSEALRQLMLGNPQAAGDYATKWSGTGGKFNISKGDDGKYHIKIDEKGKIIDQKADLDTIGMTIQYLMSQDPSKRLDKARDERVAANTKANENQFALDKMDREYELKGQLEKEKMGAEGKVAPYRKQLYNMSRDAYGATFANGSWSFGDANKESNAAARADLATSIYESGVKDTNSANNTASKLMKQYTTQAENYADKEEQEGKIDIDQRDERVAELIRWQVDKKIARMRGESSASPQKPPPEAGKVKAEGGKPDWNKFLAGAIAKGKEIGKTEQESTEAAIKAYRERWGEPPAKGEDTTANTGLVRR